MSFPELSSVNQLTDPLWKRLGSTDQRKIKKRREWGGGGESKREGRASSKTCGK